MADLRRTLLRLRENLNILQEREAKYAGEAPLALRNEIGDHRQAIDLIEQVLRGELTEAELREATRHLLVTLPDDDTGTQKSKPDRDRELMFERLKDTWVRGVLEESLSEAPELELCFKQVDPSKSLQQAQDQNSGDSRWPPGTSIVKIFEETGQSLLILGEPGAGKTFSLLKLARSLIA